MVSSIAAKTLQNTSRVWGSKGLLAKNLKTIAGDYGHNLLQDHASLKINALIVSSLIIVLSRIGIAYGSAQKSKGTPDEEYRRQEFFRTSIREIGGWTLSFFVFRFFERQVKRGILKLLKIGSQSAVGLKDHLKQMGKDIIQWAKGDLKTARVPQRGPFIGSEASFSSYDPNVYNKPWVKSTIELFSRNNPSLSVPEKISNFYDWFPILVGSVPAIYLSGYALERFSMDKSKMVVDSFNNWLNARRQKHLPYNGKNPFLVPHTPQENDFTNYFYSVRQKQMGRTYLR